MTLDLLTTTEAAEVLKIHRVTLWKWLKTGKIRGAKIGRVWRIKREDLESFVNGRK